MPVVSLTKTAARQITGLSKRMKQRVCNTVRQLENGAYHSGARRLTGNLHGLLRKRIGEYRLVFRIVSDEVIVEAIEHRKSVYRGKAAWSATSGSKLRASGSSSSKRRSMSGCALAPVPR
ncbi:MAG: type II toxin-antitoxin system RelE/ParE family toxin [Pirellulales bacterium]|nr:type II toxin-antitoxin system RelE/ParE family toxin [Pirellulales bacterium]